jgi:hypothetical protein
MKETKKLPAQINVQKIAFPSGAWFAPSPAALVSSLFDPGGTASGFFKVRKRGVLFCRGNGEPLVFLVANKRGERFFVSCGRQSDGRIVFMHSMISRDREVLGIPEKMAESSAMAESIWALCN